jgi:tetratricopeptide (TPR) repeat protein
VTASTVKSGGRIDRLAELEEERRYLLRSLKDLEREREAGDVDDDDYRTLKDGYTVRAASVLRQIDDGRRSLAPKRRRDWKRIVAVVVAAVACSAGIGFALASAFGERGATDEITGLNPADSVRAQLAGARAALTRGEFDRANQLFLQVDRAELDRGSENAEARAYLGWTLALVARQSSGQLAVDDERLDLALLALNQAIEMEPTYADPYCFAAIIEFNFRGDADAALPYVEECESNNPPADIAGLIESFGAEIRAAAEI